MTHLQAGAIVVELGIVAAVMLVGFVARLVK